MPRIPFAKSYYRRCPDGTKKGNKKLVYRNPNDALPMYLRHQEASLGADLSATSLEARYASGLQSVLAGLDRSVSGLIVRFRIAYAGYATDPCTNEASFQRTVEQLAAEQGRLDAQRLQIAAFIALAEAIPNDAARLHDAYLVLLQQITTAPAPAEAAPLQIEQSHVEAERWIEPPAPSLGQQP